MRRAVITKHSMKRANVENLKSNTQTNNHTKPRRTQWKMTDTEEVVGREIMKHDLCVFMVTFYYFNT